MEQNIVEVLERVAPKASNDMSLDTSGEVDSSYNDTSFESQKSKKGRKRKTAAADIVPPKSKNRRKSLRGAK